MSGYVARSPDTNQTGHSRDIIPANAAEIATRAELCWNSTFFLQRNSAPGLRTDTGTYATRLLASMRNAG
jgi:hypothetical protein